MKKILLLFFLFGLFHCIDKITLTDEKTSKERIFSTIKLILMSIHSNLLKREFEYEFPKYNIEFSNFRTLNPTEKEFNIEKVEGTSDTYSVKNLIITFIYDNRIKFFDIQDIMEDNYKIIELTFKEIRFNLGVDGLLQLTSSEVESYHMSKNNMIGSLKYFQEYNNAMYGDEESTIKKDLKKNFKSMLEDRVENVLNQINLYTYDLQNILELATTNITCSKPDEYKIDFIMIESFDFDYNGLSIDYGEAKLKLTNLKLKGIFLTGEIETEFEATLSRDKELILDENKIEFSNNDPFTVSLSDLRYKKALNEDFVTCLEQKHFEYYNSLREN